MKTLFKKVALASAIAGFAAGSVNAASYSSRIIGGADAPSDTYPWMVSVQNREDGEHFCGGSLVAGSYVLTAAHCLEDTPASELQVVISEFDLANTSGAEETIQAKNIYVHEGYGDDNDIAVIELDTASTKSPVQLADTALNDSITVGSNLTVMGWGNQATEGESFPNILQEVQVPLADHAQCKTNYEGVDIEITDNMICAGLPEGGKDSCQGDSGGPIVYQKDSSWFQTGVVSFGEGCAEKDFYGVYTKVANYSDWIAKVQAGEIEPFVPSEDHDDDYFEDDYDEDDYNEDDYGHDDEHGDWDDEEFGEDEFDDEHDEDEYADGDDEDGHYDDEDGHYDDDEDDEWGDDEFDFEGEENAFELPEYVDFVALESGETVEDSVVVFNTNDTDLTIQGVSIDNDQHFSILSNGCDTATLKPEEECEVVLSYTASEEDELHEATLTIATSDEDDSSVDIPLFGALLSNLELDDHFDGLDGIDDEEWYFEGDDAWMGDEDSGSFNLAIDGVAVDSEAMLMTNIEGPGTLSFDMNLTGDAAGNTLTFLVDGEAVTSLSSERSDKSHTVELSEGEHQVAWIYSKTEESEATAVASISDIEFESANDDDDLSDEDGDSDFDNDDLDNEDLDNEEVQDAVDTIADAVSGAGSTDAFLIALLALFGISVRSRK